MREPDQRSPLRLPRVALVSLALTASGPLAGAGGVSAATARAAATSPCATPLARILAWAFQRAYPGIFEPDLAGRAQCTITRNAAVGEGAVAGLGWQERGLPSAAARGKPRRAS
jgi:hypothetical protein